jgi:hypothetical protein
MVHLMPDRTIDFLDLIGACHKFVAATGRLVPQMRGRRLSEDEREVIHKRDFLREGRDLRVDSDPCDQVRWRTAALVYLRGTAPPEHHLWRVHTTWDYCPIPVEFPCTGVKLFAEHWGPVMGVIEGLLALHQSVPSAGARRGQRKVLPASPSRAVATPTPRPAQQALPAAPR